MWPRLVETAAGHGGPLDHMTRSHSGDPGHREGHRKDGLQAKGRQPPPGAGREAWNSPREEPAWPPSRHRERSLLLQLPAGSVPAAQGATGGLGRSWRVGEVASISPDSHAWVGTERAPQAGREGNAI